MKIKVLFTNREKTLALATSWSLVLMSLFFIFVGAVIYKLVPENVSLRIPAAGMADGSRTIAVRAINPGNLREVFYSGQSTGTVQDGFLVTEWAPPKGLLGKGLIIEVCTQKSGGTVEKCFRGGKPTASSAIGGGYVAGVATDDDTMTSCPYYMSLRKPSKIANLLGANNIDITSHVYCSNVLGAAAEFTPYSRVDVVKSTQQTGVSYDDGVMVVRNGQIYSESYNDLFSRITSDIENDEEKTTVASIDASPSVPQTLSLVGQDLTISDGNTISLPVATDPIASTSNDGYLSASDWNEFSAKENSLTFDSSFVRTGDTISLMSCAIGEILKNNGATWVCAADASGAGSYTAGTGIAISGLSAISNTGLLGVTASGALSASAGQNPAITMTTTGDLNQLAGQLGLTNTGVSAGTYNNVTVDAKGRVSAATNVSYLTTEGDGVIGNEVAGVVAGGGLVMTGSGTGGSPYVLGLVTTCSSGQIMKWNGSVWNCAADIDTDTNTDQQTLSYNPGTNILGLLNGGTIDLSDLQDNTDSQAISRTGNTISITGSAGTVDLTPYLDNTDGQTLTITPGLAGSHSVAISGGNSQSITESQALNWVSGTRTLSITNGGSVVISDTDTTYSAGNGLGLAGTVFSVNSPTCSGTTKLQWNGTAFVCAADVDTTYTAGTGITLSSGQFSLTNDFGASIDGSEITNGTVAAADLANSGATAGTYGDTGVGVAQLTVNAQGQVTAVSNRTLPTASTSITGVLSSSDWNTFNGKENVLTFTGNGLFSRSGNTITGSTCGTTGHIMKWNGSAFACATDIDTDTTYTAGTGITLSSGQFSLTNDFGASIDSSEITNGTIATSDIGTGAVETSNILDGTIGFNDLGANSCVAGEIIKRNAGNTAWVCASDVDTNTDAVSSVFGRTGGVTAQSGDYTAAQVTNTAAGTIAATTVQAALNELDTEKLGVSLSNGALWVGNGSNVATAVTASGDVLISNTGVTTIQANSVALGTDTTGNYVAGATSGNGITVSGTAGEGWSPTVAINSPTCSGGQYLTWSGSAFSCGTPTDTDTDTTNFNIAANGGAAQNIAAGNTVNFVNGTGTSASRTGNDISYGLTNVGTAGTYGSATTVPVITTDAQGRITSVTNTAITFPAEADGVIGNEVVNATANGGLARAGSGTGGSPYTLGLLTSCGDQQVLKWTLGTTSWGCANDTDTTYTAGTGITLSSGQFSLTNDFGASIDSSEITNGTIAAGDLANSGATAGTYGDTGVNVSQLTVNAQGQVTAVSNRALPTATTSLTGVLSSADWNTFNGKENVLTFSDGLTRSGNTVTLMDCAASEVLKRNGGDTAWVCATDLNTDAVTTVFGRTGAITAQNGDYTASQITNVAAGTVAAITVQGAINELDTEKLSVTLNDGQLWVGNVSNVATAVTPSGDVLISNTGVTTIQANSVALGTDTTGNYVAGNTAGTGISVTGAAGEGWSPTIAIANTAVSANTYAPSDNANGSLAVPQFTVNAQGQLTAASTTNVTVTGIANSQLANNAITVTAGNGLANGGSAALGASTTLNIGAGNGITVNADDITIRLTTTTDGLSATTSSSSGLEVLTGGLSLLQGCANNDILKWNETTDVWACGVDANTDAVASVFGRTGAVVATAGDYTATLITNTAAGNIASTTVQAAINELDSEKLAVTLADGAIWVGNGSNVATAVTPSGDVAITNTGVTTIQANSVALGTDTTGNYVAGNTGGTGITISGAAGEGWSPTIAISNTTVTANSYAPANNANGSIALPQFTVNAQGQLTAASTTNISVTGIANSQLANNAVTVTAGSGLVNGGSVALGATTTLNIGAGNGITVNADDIAVRLTAATDALSATTSSGSGLEVLSTGVTMLQGCADGQLLKWAEATDLWACAADIDTNTDAVSTVFGRAGAVVATAGDYTATQVTNTAAGTIASTTVQAALNELDTEKLAVTLANGAIWVGNGSGVATAVTPSGDVLITNTGVTTIQSDSVALGTDTTGNYVAGNTGGTGITISGAAGEGWSPTIAITNTTVTANSYAPANNANGSIALPQFTVNAQGQLTAASTTNITVTGIANSQLANNAITVTAGNGLANGGSAALGATTTLNIGAGNGITVNADDIAVRLTTATDALSATTSSGSGLEVLSTGVTMLQGCADGQLLKWAEATDLWACAADIDTNTDAVSTVFGRAGAVVATAGDYTATQVTNTAAGTIAATTVQAALNELDTEKLAVTLANGAIWVGNGSGVATAVTPSGDVLISNTGVTTIQANSVALGTDTTGNYVAGNTGGTGITISGAAGEGWSPTIAITNTTVTANSYAPADNANGSLALPQFTVNAQGQLTAASTTNITVTGIANSQLANNAVTVAAGSGLINGGSVALGGTTTVNIGAGAGITVNADDITVDLTVATDALSATTSNGSGLEVLASGVTLLQGCADGQILKWVESTDVWNCAADNGAAPTIGAIDGQAKVANGAVIASNVLYMQTADASNPGLVSTAAQTFAGAKTFSAAIAANGGITFDNATDTLGAFTLAGTQDAANNLITNIGNAGTDFTAGGGLTLASTLTANGALTVNTCANTVTNVLCDGGNTRAAAIVVGTNDANTFAIETGGTTRFIVGAAASTLTGQGATTLSSTSTLALSSAAASGITITSGTTGALALDSGSTGSISVGTSANAKTITFGNTTGATGLVLTTGTAGILASTTASTTDGLTYTANSITTATAFQLNVTGLTSGNAFQITGPTETGGSGGNTLLRVRNDDTQGYNQPQVVIGEGDANNPDTLARDSLYVFGRINSSWNMQWSECLSGLASTTASTAGVLTPNGYIAGNTAAGTVALGTVVNGSGVCRLTTTSTTTAGQMNSLSGGTINSTQRQYNPVYEARVSGTTANGTTQRAVVGFTNRAIGNVISTDATAGATTANNFGLYGAFFRKNAADTTWSAVTTNNGTATTTALATTINTFHRLRVEVDNVKTEVRFYADGVLVATHTTNLPPATQFFGYTASQGSSLTTAGTAITLDIDYMRVWSDDPPTSSEVTDSVVEALTGDSAAPSDTGVSTEDPVDESADVAQLRQSLPGVFIEGSDQVDSVRLAIELLGRLDATDERVSSLGGRVDQLAATVESLQSAIWNGGLVSDDTTFDGLVNFKQQVSFGDNNVGTVTVSAGQTTARVTLPASLASLPRVTAAKQSFTDGDWRITEVTRSGFVVELQRAQSADVVFDWHAFAGQ